ncbi:MAG: SRPBCC domain-containing protein [Acidimicrobiia bacterium]
MSQEVIRVVRRVDASPEVVFAYLTSSEKWSQWQGVSTTIDPRPGGVYTMRAPNGGTARGEVIEVVTNERISFTWGWETHPVVPPGSTTVTIELTAEGEATIVTLTHSGLPEGEIGLHRRGWDHYATRLARVAAGTDIGPDRGLPT